MKKIIILLTMVVALDSCTTDADDEWDAAKVCPESKRGTFVDERDGQVYKYTTIGDQVWMAENLRYKSEGSECYYKEDDCNSMGRAYNLDLTLCPTGWHVPSEEDWYLLIDEMGGGLDGEKKLKASSGWYALNPGENPNGTDNCGFGAVYADNGVKNDFYKSSFLTSSLKKGSDVYLKFLLYSYDHVAGGCGIDCNFYPAYLRCIRD